MTPTEIFGAGMAILNVIFIPILKVMWDRIKEAKEEGIAQAAFAIKEVTAISDEAKALAIDALDKLHAHKLHIAENYISVKRFEGFEATLFKKLDSIESKLDGKQDKAGNH